MDHYGPKFTLCMQRHSAVERKLKSKNVIFLFLLKWMKFILFTCFSVPMNLFSSVYYFLVNHLISDETLWPDVNKTRKNIQINFRKLLTLRTAHFRTESGLREIAKVHFLPAFSRFMARYLP